MELNNFKQEIENKALAFYISHKESDFVPLYNLLFPYYKMIARKSYVKDFEQAQSIASLALTKIWQNIDKCKPEQFNFYNYFSTIFTNVALGDLKDHKRVRNIEYIDVENTHFIEEHIYNKDIDEAYENILNEIDKLDKYYKDLLYDRYVLRLTNKQMCEKRNLDPEIKKQTIKNGIFRAKKILRKNIDI